MLSASRPARVEQVLAVVEHEQELLRAQVVDDALGERHARSQCHPERAGDHLDRFLLVAGHRQLAQPRAVGVLLREVLGDLHREPRLPDPAGPRDRHERYVAELLGDRADGVLPPDERRRLRREVAGDRADRAERREVVGQPGRDHLEHALGA